LRMDTRGVWILENGYKNVVFATLFHRYSDEECRFKINK